MYREFTTHIIIIFIRRNDRQVPNLVGTPGKIMKTNRHNAGLMCVSGITKLNAFRRAPIEFLGRVYQLPDGGIIQNKCRAIRLLRGLGLCMLPQMTGALEVRINALWRALMFQIQAIDVGPPGVFVNLCCPHILTVRKRRAEPVHIMMLRTTRQNADRCNQYQQRFCHHFDSSQIVCDDRYFIAPPN